MQTQQFKRKAFVVTAVRVTQKNIHEVARWCGGSVQSKATDKGKQRFIKVKVHRPLNEKQTQAFVGDWVVKAEAGWKVYTNRAFNNSFEESIVYSEKDALEQLGEDVCPNNCKRPLEKVMVDDEVVLKCLPCAEPPKVFVTPGGNIFSDQEEGLQELRVVEESAKDDELTDEERELREAGVL